MTKSEWFNVPEKTRAAPVFQKPPEGHGDVLRWRDFYVATLEKTQLIAKDFSELRIHFWPDTLYSCKLDPGS
ncbi:predicted protein [Histoplasma mississippiense (nom. inval.)]|uniref:predicted protein n=1 Tax=Ajellomyces capsulatus (strain NAm1 / WU24) TaxID=2059318 RepID=UPI000157D2E0|nr:predicted protein [Histoplasma mississippiense (nom. inval.)]EDN04456.1 predicted protein [Histoplasma mississippiense (nom. inval.)]